jgi:hypothetical protein
MSKISNHDDNNSQKLQYDLMNSIENTHICLSTENIIRFFLNNLSDKRRSEVESHFTKCDTCSAKLFALEVGTEVDSMRRQVKSCFNLVDKRKSRSVHPTVQRLEERELPTLIVNPFISRPLINIAEIQNISNSKSHQYTNNPNELPVKFKVSY